MMQAQQNEMQTSADCVVIKQVLNGNVALFEVLIRRYNTVLYRIARGYGFNHQDAEDLIQDTHIIAYTQLAKFEGRAAYKTWISRIMINKCLYKLKYGYYRKEINETEKGVRAICGSEMLSGESDQRLLNHELASVLEKSIQNIPESYRTVFILREVEGFSIAETAQLMQISENNVKVRLNRSKSMLQEQIKQLYDYKELYSFNLIYCDGIVFRVLSRINLLEHVDMKHAHSVRLQ